jgi:hypothetical protein
VIALVVVLVALATSIAIGGILTGGWMWGAIFGISGAAAIAEWLQLRSLSPQAQRVADRMITATSVLLFGVAMPALRIIESEFGGLTP